ncbi:PAS domain S-box protein [Pedobacter agri]|uniref:histidine kinase n=1 Tax=Pedobacter agri TaxID=454586 RepID=A0A9X3DAH3_9SPHI|nr:PAS domain S-box protein [Pedobacter agri]MCX3263927.1 PAS domain S-box protein [Pedobacter agri]
MSHHNYLLSNEQLLQVFNLTHTATAIHVTEDAIIQEANDAMLRIWGKDRRVIGKSLEEALPELKGQPFIDMFKAVWREGLTISGKDTAADLEIEGEISTFYFDFEYKAVKDESGQVICILHTAIDVTERFLKKEAEERAAEKEMALQREQELNEELAATNEELLATNEELQVAQDKLSSLNNDLEERVLKRVRELSESEERFRTMAEGTDIFIAVGDETGNAIYFNKPWVELTGRSMNDLLEFGWADLIHPDDRERYVGIYLSALAKKTPFTGEFRILSKEGNYRWLLANGPPRLHPDGTFAGYISSCIDITDRKKHQEELQELNEEMAAANEELASTNEELAATNQELAQTHSDLVAYIKKLSDSEEKLLQAIETGKMGTWSINPETMEITMSAFVRDLLGLSMERSVNIDEVMKAVDNDYHQMLLNALDNALKNHVPSDTEYPITNLITGEEKWVKATGKVFLDQQGNPTEYSGMFMDITERKLDELRKNDFIGMVSHELKTPLTAINGFVQVLQRKAKNADDDYSTNALDKAYIQVRKMTAMINGFLNVSRLESGKLLVDKRPFRLDQLLQETIDESFISPSTHEINFDSSCEVTVNGDRDKIGNVISNLLSNAHKYSANGTNIEVNCEITDTEVIVSVRDEGIGISEHDAKKLFERYYRVETNHTISGFGIGLYLSAEIIERHNGRIWVESETGKGSVFYFTLPLS